MPTNVERILTELEKGEAPPELQLVMADLMEEEGKDDLAFAYRWCAITNREPKYYKVPKFWDFAYEIEYPGRHILSRSLWQAMPTSYSPSYQKLMEYLARGLRNLYEELYPWRKGFPLEISPMDYSQFTTKGHNNESG